MSRDSGIPILMATNVTHTLPEDTPMTIDLPLIAGTISTIIFALSTLPMLRKAFRTKDLRSYSPGNMVLANVGNAVHSVYVFALPPGPIWLLHSFYLVTTGLMLAWYLRYEWHPRRRPASGTPGANLAVATLR
jgi:uncharacterized protein with PQ loop repeat